VPVYDQDLRTAEISTLPVPNGKDHVVVLFQGSSE